MLSRSFARFSIALSSPPISRRARAASICGDGFCSLGSAPRRGDRAARLQQVMQLNPQSNTVAAVKGWRIATSLRTFSSSSDTQEPSPADEEWPCKKTWCSGDRRKHLLLCVTSEKHFGNCYTHICSRPEIWLMKMGDPWARHGANDQIVGLEPELVPPPKRVLEMGFDGLTADEKQLVDVDLLEPEDVDPKGQGE